MKNLLKRIALALTTGYIYFFYSERIFWSFFWEGDSLGSNIGGFLLYSFFAYVILIVIRQFKVRAMDSLLIAGALFGWLGEGVVAMTFFGAEVSFPITVSWTGLAWHALITFFVGWYLMLTYLKENSKKKIILLSCGLGVFWGYWSTAWPLETPPVITSIPGFFIHAFFTAGLAVLAYRLIPALKPSAFQATKAEKIIASLLVLVFYSFVTVPMIGPMALILILFFLAVYWALRVNKKIEEQPDVLNLLDAPAPKTAYILIFFMPLIAAIIYSIFISMPFLIHRSNLYLMIVTTILGFGFSLWSFYSVLRRRRLVVAKSSVVS